MAEIDTVLQTLVVFTLEPKGRTIRKLMWGRGQAKCKKKKKIRAREN